MKQVPGTPIPTTRRWVGRGWVRFSAKTATAAMSDAGYFLLSVDEFINPNEAQLITIHNLDFRQGLRLGMASNYCTCPLSFPLKFLILRKLEKMAKSQQRKKVFIF